MLPMMYMPDLLKATVVRATTAHAPPSQLLWHRDIWCSGVARPLRCLTFNAQSRLESAHRQHCSSCHLCSEPLTS